MKIFQTTEIRQAIEHSQLGGQALHLHPFTQGHPLFKRYKQIAHLFDQDLNRLHATVKALGVRVVKVEHLGTHKQHVDLCGRPLERAKAKAQELSEVSEFREKLANFVE